MLSAVLMRLEIVKLGAEYSAALSSTKWFSNAGPVLQTELLMVACMHKCQVHTLPKYRFGI